jgi:hypothetical protein
MTRSSASTDEEFRTASTTADITREESKEGGDS